MEWRACARYPAYEISECGDIRRRVAGYNRPVGYRLKGFVDLDGYLRYAFRDEGHKVSVPAYRLVAEAFIGPAPSPKHEAAHKNGSRVSCYFGDLRWCLSVENKADMVVHGTKMQGEKNFRAKITEEDVHDIRREYRRVKTNRIKGGLAALDAKYGLNRGTMIHIAQGVSWRHVPFTAADCGDEDSE